MAAVMQFDKHTFGCTYLHELSCHLTNSELAICNCSIYSALRLTADLRLIENKFDWYLSCDCITRRGLFVKLIEIKLFRAITLFSDGRTLQDLQDSMCLKRIFNWGRFNQLAKIFILKNLHYNIRYKNKFA